MDCCDAPVKAKILKISPDSLSFEGTKVHGTSDPEAVVLKNGGWVDVIINRVEVIGDFTLDDSALSTVIKPGGKSELGVTFTPTKSGSISGVIKIDAGKAGDYEVSLRGLATQGLGKPSITFRDSDELDDPGALDYPADTLALVAADPDPTKNGIWEKLGDVGQGSWNGPISAFAGSDGDPGPPGENADTTITDSLTASVGSLSAAISALPTTADLLALSDLLDAEILARTQSDDTINTTLGLIGSVSPDGQSFILNENTFLVSPTETFAQYSLGVANQLSTTAALVSAETTARVTAISAEASRIDSVEASVVTTNAAVTAESQARATAILAEAVRIDTVITDLGDANSAIASEVAARISAIAAEAQARQQVNARIDDVEVDIVQEQNARATADTAEANARLALETRVEVSEEVIVDNAAAISVEATSRADADSALAVLITNLDADFYDGQTGIAAHVSIAEGHAASASAAAANASFSEDLTAGYATSANQAAQQTIPSTFEADDEFFGGDNGNLNDVNMSFVDTANGRAARVANAAGYGLVSTLKHRPSQPGDKFLVRALIAHVSGTPQTAQLRLEGYAKSAHDGDTTRESVLTATTAVITSTTPVWYEFTFTAGNSNFQSAAVVTNFPSPYQAVQDCLALEYFNVTAQEEALASASVATSKAAEASASAANASSSETVSAAHATTQRNTLAQEFPKEFNPYLFTSAGITSGAPSQHLSEPEVPATAGRVAPDLSYIEAPAGEYDLTHLGAFSIEEGHIYEIFADVECIDDGGQTDTGFSFYGRNLDDDFTYLSNAALNGSTLTALPEGERKTISFTIGRNRPDADNNISSGSPNKRLRPVLLLNRRATSSATTPNSVMRTHGFWVEDITAVRDAEAEASVATSRAAEASASASQASTSVTVAASHESGAQAFSDTRGITPNGSFEAGIEGQRNGVAAGTDPETYPTALTAVSDFQGAKNVIRTAAGQSAHTSGIACPIDTTRKYRMHARIWSSGSGGTIYAGFACVGADGSNVGSNSGLGYPLVVNAALSAGWHEFTSVVITGINDTSNFSSAFRTGTVAAIPIALVNYNSNPNQEYAIDYLYFEDVTESEEASSQAIIATQQVSLATAEVAKAEEIKNLTASIGTGFENGNATFTSGVIGTTPTAGADVWQNWSGPTANKEFIEGDGQRPIAMRIAGPATENSGIYINGNGDNSRAPVEAGVWYVLEADVELSVGTWRGGFVYINPRDGNDGNNSLGGYALSFTGEDVSGTLQGDGAVGDRRKFSGIFQAPADSTHARLYAMAHWPGITPLNGTSTGWNDSSAANEIICHTVGYRKATQAEIEQNAVLGPLEASVAVNASTIASNATLAAAYQIIAAATGSSPAMVQLLAGIAGSKVGLVADVIALGNEIDGVVVEAFRLVNGVAEMDSAIIRRLRVPPRTDSTILMDVELSPIQLLAADGETLTYQSGATFGSGDDALPRIVADISQLPQEDGSRYEWGVTNKTGTSAIARLKKIASGTIASHSYGPSSNVSGTPNRVINKTSATDAYDGNYEFSLDVVASVTSTTVEGVTRYDYVAEGQLYADTGSGLAVIGSYIETWESHGTPGSSLRTITRVANYSGAIGAKSPGFGAHAVQGSISEINSVSYSGQSGGTETAVTTKVPWSIYPPKRN